MSEKWAVISLHLLFNLAAVYAKTDEMFMPVFERVRNVYIKGEISLGELEKLVSSFEQIRLKFLAEKKKLPDFISGDDIQLAQIAVWALYIVADNYWQLADMYCQCGALFEEYRSKFETIRNDMWHMKNEKGLISIGAIISAQVELDDTRNNFIDALNEFLALDSAVENENI